MEQKRYGLNIYFGIYLIYVLYTWVWDTLSFSEYYLNVNELKWFNAIGSFVIVIVVTKIATKYFSLEKKKISLGMKIVILIMILSALIRCMIPDLSYDSSQMHFPRMYPGFYDNVDKNVFSYGLGSYMWFLGDRLFFIPYLLLGYRLAPIINVFVNIISYIITMEILEMFMGKTFKKIFVIAIEIIAGIALFSYYNTMDWSLYMVDLFAIPFLLQMLKMTIESIKQKQIKNKVELIIFAVLGGFAFALKMTNFIFVLPLIIVYIYHRKSNITVKVFVAAFIIAILPFSLYLIYSFIETGNPVFPTYNAIFKSDYYAYQNFKDTRWGPENGLQLLIWPLVTLIGPFNRLSELAPPIQGMAFIGMIAGGIIIMKERKSKDVGEYFSIYLIYLVQTYLWCMTTGYARYFIFGEIFAGILLNILIIKISGENSTGKGLKGIASGLAILMMFQVCIGEILIFNKGHEWAWRKGAVSSDSVREYMENSKNLLKDKGVITSKELQNEINYILQINELSNVNYLISNQAPKINLYALNTTLNMRDANQEYLNKIYSKILQEKSLGKRFFSTDLNSNFPRLVDDCNNSGVYIKDLQIVNSYFSPSKEIILIELDIPKEKTKNKIEWIDDDVQEEHFITVSNTGDAKIVFKGIVSIAPYVTWNIDNNYFKIVAIDERGIKKEVFSKKLDKLHFYNIEKELDTTGLNGDIRFQYENVLDNGQNTEWKYVNVINGQFIMKNKEVR